MGPAGLEPAGQYPQRPDLTRYLHVTGCNVTVRNTLRKSRISPNRPALDKPRSRAEIRATRRAELLEAALRVIRRDGDSVSMEAIAAEAGITRPILYRHFGDVGGLYHTIAHNYTATLSERLVVATDAAGLERKEQLRAQIDAFLSFIEEEPQLYRFLTRQLPRERPEQREIETEFVRMLASDLASFLASLGMHTTLARTTADALVGGVRAAADHWLDAADLPRANLADQLTAFYWNGFAGVADPVRTKGQRS